MQAGDRDARPGYGIPLVSEEGPDREELGRELADVIQQIFKSGLESPRFVEWQQQKHATESLSRRRYRLLRAYADVAREIRTKVVFQALEQYPDLTNTALRAILEEHFGNGSFEPTRYSDTRINNLRQMETVLSRSAYD